MDCMRSMYYKVLFPFPFVSVIGTICILPIYFETLLWCFSFNKHCFLPVKKKKK